MGTQSRKASDRAMARVSVPSTERETLLPCPACEGARMKTEELDNGKYRATKCRWCDGNGCVDKKVFSMFRRWLRIYKHNRIYGDCSQK